ncbi:hypothetical protein ACPV3O_23160 [Vibrio rotiferianus]|uniref:hypothetical protein n=1 Tax=Vibrio rotiferianus TaxID=190895 RepID=UPI00406A5816
MKKLILISSILLMLSGCQSTKSDSALNPTLSNYHIEKLAVLAVNSPDIEDLVTEELTEQGTHATAVRNLLAFSKDENDFFNNIVRQGYSDILVINYSIGGRQLTVTGYNTTANTYDTYNGSNTFGTTSAITASTNNAVANATIINTKGVKVWQSNINLSAGGHLYTDDASMIEGLGEAVIEELEKSTLL